MNIYDVFEFILRQLAELNPGIKQEADENRRFCEHMNRKLTSRLAETEGGDK